MDERQTKIRAGAGLEESRINQDFIEFISKWSTPVLWLLVLVGGAWWGMRYLKERRIARIDAAFTSLNETLAGGNPSPQSLRAIATEYEGVRSVSDFAMLRACDIYLRAAIAGVEPGAEIDRATGLPANESDRLDADGVARVLSQARDLARSVIGSASKDEGKKLIEAQAWLRLAAAQEGLGSEGDAKASYDAAASAARAAGAPALALFAEGRKDAARVAGLPSGADLAPLPGEEPAPEPTEPTTAAPDGEDQDATPAADEPAPASDATPTDAPATADPAGESPAS